MLTGCKGRVHFREFISLQTVWWDCLYQYQDWKQAGQLACLCPKVCPIISQPATQKFTNLPHSFFLLKPDIYWCVKKMSYGFTAGYVSVCVSSKVWTQLEEDKNGMRATANVCNYIQTYEWDPTSYQPLRRNTKKCISLKCNMLPLNHESDVQTVQQCKSGS